MRIKAKKAGDSDLLILSIKYRQFHAWFWLTVKSSVTLIILNRDGLFLTEYGRFLAGALCGGTPLCARSGNK